jgi:hypothetical protein
MKWGVPVAAFCAFVGTATFRFLALAGFPNDEHEYLAAAQQIVLGGEWPTKDFFDPGRPLMDIASAGATWLFGNALFGEAVLTALAYGLAAACIVVAAHRLSRSLLVAAVVTALSVAIFPRPYSYPKILLYVVGPLLMWAWAARPSTVRLAAMAFFLAIAFLLRHDHLVYLGIAVLATIVLTSADSIRQRRARVALFVSLVLLALVPYAVYVQTYEGLIGFLRASLEYSRREADRTSLHLASLGWGHDARLFHLFYFLPFAVLACVGLDWLLGRRTDAVIAIPLAALAIVVNVGFLRDPLPVRIADAVVPAALLGAWLAGRALRLSGTWCRLGALAVLVLVTVGAATSVFAVGDVGQNWNRSELNLGVGGIPGAFKRRTEELHARFSPRHVPSGRIGALLPFFEYVERCTTIRHRLFVTGYAPEVFTYARRLFAGGHGQFIQGYHVSSVSQRRIVERMTEQYVLFALVLTDEEAGWRQGLPDVDRYLHEQFAPMADIPVDEERTIQILVNRGAPPEGRDEMTGWPCYQR